MMKIDQTYIDEEVKKPIMLQLDEIRKLLKSNDRDLNRKIDLISENIARIPKKRK